MPSGLTLSVPQAGRIPSKVNDMTRFLTLAACAVAGTLTLAPSAALAQTPYKIVLSSVYIQSCGLASLEDCAKRYLGDVWRASAQPPTSGDIPFEIHAVREGGAVLAAGNLRVNASALPPRRPYTNEEFDRATVWSFTTNDRDYARYLTAAHHVILVPRTAYLYLGLAAEASRDLAASMKKERAELDKTRAALQAIEKSLAALDARLANFTGSVAADACQPSAALQNQFRGLQNDAAARLTDLRNEVTNMRNRLAVCRTAADAEAIRLAWARAAQRGDQVTAAAASAVGLRQQMIDEIAMRSGRRGVDAGLISAEIERYLSDLDAIQRSLSAPLSIGRASVDLQASYLDSVPTNLATLTDPFVGAPSWVREVWGLAVDEARRLAADYAKDIPAAARRLVDDKTLVDRLFFDQDLAKSDAVTFRRRLEAMPERVKNAACGTIYDPGFDIFDRAQRDARTALDESDRIFSVSDRCVTGTPPVVPPPVIRQPDVQPPRPPVNPPVTPPTAQRILRASLDCGGVIEVVAGQISTPCGVRVRAWDSNTTEPVRVSIEPPFTAASGLSAAPGDTSQAGDTMYAAGVNDRSGEYVFGEGFSAARGTKTGTTIVLIVVRQRDLEVRLPLRIGVRQGNQPTNITQEVPVPTVNGSGGPYCVWQYKLVGDPVGCWHMAAAGCTEPRYAGRPEYVLVGNNMTRGQADKRVGDLSYYFNNGACRASNDPFLPGARTHNPNPPNPNGTPANLHAELECGGQLEIVSGGRPETCGVRVTGWRSDTRTPVEIILDPPFSRASGIRVAPGDTSQGGDALYASGVNDRFGQYVFGEGFSAERGAPDSSNTLAIVVRQGNAQVRLQLTVNVVPEGTPPGSSFVPPTPNVTGSGGPYCVWQFKTFIDAPACWNGVAAGCTEPRYANRREYVMVGNNMSKSEADRRIGEISQFFDRSTCTEEGRIEKERKEREEREKRERAERERREEEERRREEERREAERRREEERREAERKKREAEKPATTLAKFGIDPRDLVMKVGQSQTFRAWGSYTGSRDMVMEIKVKWSGDISPQFTATQAHAGSKLSLTATAPDGSEDTIYVTVESVPTTAGALPGLPPIIRPGVKNAYDTNTYTASSCDLRMFETAQNYKNIHFDFADIPPSLVPGREYTIRVNPTALDQKPEQGTYSDPPSGYVGVSGDVEWLEQKPAYVNINPRVQSGGIYRFRVKPGAQKASIALACSHGPGTFATFNYGKQ
jgi:hypothetical protein